MMLAMHKEIVISQDLRYISIECSHCKTRVVMDMKDDHKLSKEQGSFSPKECPACLAKYDSAIPNNVDYLRRTYVGMLPIADSITFRGEPEIAVLSNQ